MNDEIKNKIQQVENLKSKKSKYLLIYINYSGRDEIIQAAQKYMIKNNNRKNKYKFDDFLFTKNIPDPDVLIRTGGYKRLSDFLLFQSSFT